jgi:hypothetical protein
MDQMKIATSVFTPCSAVPTFPAFLSGLCLRFVDNKSGPRKRLFLCGGRMRVVRVRS